MKRVFWLAVAALCVGWWTAAASVATAQVFVANPTARFVGAGGSVAIVPLPAVSPYYWSADRAPYVVGAYPSYPYYQPFVYQPPVVYGNPYASFVTPYQVGYRFPGAGY
jgi:hypothetical protein